MISTNGYGLLRLTYNLNMLVFEKKDEVTPYQGVARAGFSFTYIPPLNAYALFGGANADSQLYLFSITKGTWSCQPTGGPKKPSSRKYHAALFLQFISCLLINGGEDNQGRCLQDFFIISIRDWKWRRLLVVKYPQPRERHSIFVRSDRDLILFGGVSHYNENTNDIWLLKEKNEREGSLNYECARIDSKSKVVPEGRFLAEGMLYNGDRLYAASLPDRGEQLRIFYFDFRLSEWREIQVELRCSQVRMFKVVPSEDTEGFVLALSDAAGRRSTPCKFYFFDTNSNRLKKLQDEADLLNNCDEACGDGSGTQILCLRQGKRLFTVRYEVLAAQQPESSIQDYLIAIKHEQYLSRELMRKNSHLEQLYREMQNYITQLHKQYVRFEEDPAVEAERARHIEDCHTLKREYSKLDRFYDSATEQVRAIRRELSAINDDFQRCMETEFDEEA